MIGIFKALRRYKPERLTAFSTFAYYYMKREIRELYRVDSNSLINNPKVYYKEEKVLWAYGKWIAEHMGAVPSVDELFEFLKDDRELHGYKISYSKDDIEQALSIRRTKKTVSSLLPYEINDSNGEFVARSEFPSSNLVPSDDLPYEEIIDLKKLKSEIKRVLNLKSFTADERTVIYLFFGLDSNVEDLTLQAIGSMMGLSRERIRQLKGRALRKLRHPARSEGLEEFYEAPNEEPLLMRRFSSFY